MSHLLKRLAGLLLILGLIFLPRLLDLDHFYARDELTIWGWTDEFTLAIWQGNWAGTFTASDYPGIPLFWAHTLFLSLKYALPTWFSATWLPLDQLGDRSILLLAERRMITGLLAGVQLLGILLLIRRLFGWPTALISTVLLGLDPFSLSEARVVRVEMTSSYFVTLSLLGYLCYLKQRRTGWVVLSGVMAGWAASTKLSGGLIVPLIWLLLLLDLFPPRSWQTAFAGPSQFVDRLKKVFLAGLLWGGSSILAFSLIWPAMWLTPFDTLSHLIERGVNLTAAQSIWRGDVFFLGQLVPDDPGLFFYPVVLLFRITPLTLVGLLLSGWLIYRNRRDVTARPQQWFVGLILGTDLLLVLELSLLVSKTDRYLLVLLPFLGIASAVGWAGLLSAKPGRVSRWSIGGGIALLLVQLALTVPVHPYYFNYWNPILGGGPVAARLVPVGAGEGIDQLMAFANQQPDSAAQTLVCGGSRPWCANLFAGKSMRYADYHSGAWFQADYATFYISQQQRQFYPDYVVDYFQAQTPRHEVILSGINYAQLYDIPHAEHFAGDQNTLTGLAQLLGYTVLGSTEVTIGSTLTIDAWWINRGAGIDRLQVALVDQTGFARQTTQTVPAPAYEHLPAQQTAIVSGTALLTIPPATPPGTYDLHWRIVDEAGQPLGGFAPDDFASQARITVTDERITTDPGDIQPVIPLNETVSSTLTLLGYNPPQPNFNLRQPSWVSLYWQASSPPPPDLLLNLSLLAKTELRLPAAQWIPVSPWPTKPGQIVQAVYVLQPPAEAPIGEYDFELTLVDFTQNSFALSLDTVEIWPSLVQFDRPDMQHSVDETFADTLTLLGYDLFLNATGERQEFAPVFYWRSELAQTQAYQLRLHLRQADSDTPLQSWTLPVGDQQAKLNWKQAEIINPTYILDMTDLPPATYHLDLELEPLGGGSTLGGTRIEDILGRTVVRIME